MLMNEIHCFFIIHFRSNIYKLIFAFFCSSHKIICTLICRVTLSLWALSPFYLLLIWWRILFKWTHWSLQWLWILFISTIDVWTQLWFFWLSHLWFPVITILKYFLFYLLFFLFKPFDFIHSLHIFFQSFLSILINSWSFLYRSILVDMRLKSTLIF